MKPIELTRDNFTEEVTNSPVPVLIDLWAPWCGPCRMMAPVIDEIAESASGFKVGKVNVDEQMEIAASLGVRSIPTLLFFKNGELADKSVGLVSKQEIESILNNLL